MKAAKADKKVPVAEDLPASTEINFAETAAFGVAEEQVVSEQSVMPVQHHPSAAAQNPVSEAPPTDEWRPMSVSFSPPDSASITDSNKNNGNESETMTEKDSPQNVADRPLMNVSFFSQEVKPMEEERPQQPETSSNIPQFMNTWQNWLNGPTHI